MVLGCGFEVRLIMAGRTTPSEGDLAPLSLLGHWSVPFMWIVSLFSI